MVKSKRIKMLALLTKGYETVLDIGTDHGLVLKEAFEHGYIKKAIASDINALPLEQAKRNLKHHPVSFVLSDGFSHIKEPFECVIIAGMGSFLIAQILEKAPKNEHITYILQANDKVEYLRKYLMMYGFSIEDEILIQDRHYYIVLIVKRGSMKLDNKDLILGPILKKKPESKFYYQYKSKQIKRIIDQTDALRQQELKQLLNIYENM